MRQTLTATHGIRGHGFGDHVVVRCQDSGGGTHYVLFDNLDELYAHGPVITIESPPTHEQLGPLPWYWAAVVQHAIDPENYIAPNQHSANVIRQRALWAGKPVPEVPVAGPRPDWPKCRRCGRPAAAYARQPNRPRRYCGDRCAARGRVADG